MTRFSLPRLGRSQTGQRENRARAAEACPPFGPPTLALTVPPRGTLTGLTVALAILLPVPAPAQSVDRVKTATGAVSGKIVETTPEKIVVKRGPIGQTEVDVNKINSVAFAGEPNELTRARSSMAGSQFEDAQQALAKVDGSKIKRKLIRQDVEYYRALCAARLALAGQGQPDAAGRAMYQFITANKHSHHLFEAYEVLGDLLVSRGRSENAEVYYRKLAAAPWPDTKMRAAVRVARALQAQGKYADALTQLDSVLQQNAKSTETSEQHTVATVLKAISLAQTGKADTGIDMLTEVITGTDPEAAELQALAYNALGICYLKLGQQKDALLAFLHVDVLYNTSAENHAEALSHLVPLWEAIGKTNRAREARELLHQRYPDSRWAR